MRKINLQIPKGMRHVSTEVIGDNVVNVFEEISNANKWCDAYGFKGLVNQSQTEFTFAIAENCIVKHLILSRVNRNDIRRLSKFEISECENILLKKGYIVKNGNLHELKKRVKKDDSFFFIDSKMTIITKKDERDNFSNELYAVQNYFYSKSEAQAKLNLILNIL